MGAGWLIKERGEHRVKKIPRSPLQEMKRTTIDDEPPNKKFEKAAREFLEDLKDRYLEFEIKGGFFYEILKLTRTYHIN